MSFKYLESLQKRGCTIYTLSHGETEPYVWTIFEHCRGGVIPVARYIQLDEALYRLKQLMGAQYGCSN